MLNRAVVLRSVLIVLSSVCLMNCGGKSYQNNVSTNKPISTGFLRLVNTLPDSPTLLAGIDGQTLTRVSFAQATGLQQLTVGKYAIDVAYLDANGTQVALINKEQISLAAEEQATVFIVGTLNDKHTHAVTNQNSTITAGSAEVQVMQTVASPANLDVYLTADGADLATATKLTTVAFDTASDLTTVSSGANYQLRVTKAGTTDVQYDSGVFTIDDMTRVMFVVVDYFGPGGNGIRVMQLTNQNSNVFPNEVLPGALRLANMIADVTNVPAVDFYVGPVGGVLALVLPGVGFGTVTALQDFLPAGTFDCKLTVANDPSTVLFTGTITLDPGDTRTLVAIQRAGSVTARATLDTTRPVSGEGQLEIINAAPTAGALDTFLLVPPKTPADSAASVVNQPVLTFAGAVKAPSTTAYDVAFTATTTTTPIAGPDSLVIADGGIYSIYAIDAAGGGGPYQIQTVSCGPPPLADCNQQ